MEQWYDEFEKYRKIELSAAVKARREAYADSVFRHVHLLTHNENTVGS